MKPCSTVIHKAKTIVIVDISGANSAEIDSYLNAAHKVISEMPPKSALILTDVTDSVYNQESSNLIKNFSAKNTPYVKASAVVGADGLRSVLLRTVAMLTKREIRAFANRPEAMDWLASHN